MKIVKLSVLALALGLSVASCETKTEENTVVEGDTTMIVEPVAPVAEPMPLNNDSMNMANPTMDPASTTPAAPGTPTEMK